MPLEEPAVMSDFSDVREWGTNRYYTDFARPQGLFDVVAVGLTRDRTMIGNIGFGRA